jgi:riboflavin biosynthesis pyrimidine reductase
MTVSLPLDDGWGVPIDPEAIGPAIEDEARSDQPWVTVNMVTSADGATAVGGVSGTLGDEVDRAVFLALRARSDVILVGSGTVTAERYRRARLDDAQQRRRQARGQAPVPRIAVVSNAGDIDLDLPLFAPGPAESRPLVLVARDAISPRRRADLERVSEVVETGGARVDLSSAMARLVERVGPMVLCEGGPILNGLLTAADLVDEWCLTLAPLLVGGDAARAAQGPPLDAPRSMRLARVWHHQSQLLLRYVRDRA